MSCQQQQQQGEHPSVSAPPPNQRGATSHHDCNPAAAGQYHAPLATREQSEGCKTSSFQWKDERGERCKDLD